MSQPWSAAFNDLCHKTHSAQGKWWLNGFWDEGASEYAEDIWKIVHQFIEIDIDRPVLYGSRQESYTEGCDLDEFKSHRILEQMGETMTVQELRKRLKAMDIDNNKRMALSEYLLDKYQKKPEALVNSPQGMVDPKELAAAQEACDAAGAALDKAVEEAKLAELALKASLAAAKAAAESAEAAAAAKVDAEAKAAEAKEAYEKVKAAEDAVRAAEAELQAAIDEITGLEKAKEDKIAECQKIIDDPSTSTVKKGRAVQERDATLAEDPLPLRKAKITQGAALKKVEKARKAAEDETEKARVVRQEADDAAAAAAKAKEDADDAKAAAEERAKESEVAKEQADAAKVAAEEAVKAAEDALEELKAQGTGTPQGEIWWMERVMKEKKKFMK